MVHSLLSLEVRVNIVNAKVYVDFELQLPNCLITTSPQLAGDSKELLSIPPVVEVHDCVFIKLLLGLLVSTDLGFGFEVGPFCFECFEGSKISRVVEVLFDKLQELLIFGFEVGLRLLPLVVEGD